MCTAPSNVNYSNVNFAHIKDSTCVAFTNVAKIMCSTLLFSTSQKSNAKYTSNDTHNFIISSCIENSYSESTEKKLKIKSNASSVPSGSWIRKHIAKIPQEIMLLSLYDSIDQTLSHLKKMGFLCKSITVAIDKHFIPRYDKTDSPYLVKSKPKNGTDTFEGYGTIQCVEKSCRAQIGVTPIRKGDSKGIIVRKLLNDCSRNNIKTRLVLLDREFFSTAVIHELKQDNRTFIMPARKTPGIKKAIEQFVLGDRESISEYTIHSASKHVESFTLVIIPKQNPKKSNITNQYVTFVTNIPMNKIFWNLHTIPEEYRKRWGIETGYACVEKFRPRTCSRNNSMRFLYFLYPLILFNAWIIANCMLRNNHSISHSNPIITIEILKCIFGIIIVDSFRKVTSEYYLGDVG